MIILSSRYHRLAPNVRSFFWNQYMLCLQTLASQRCLVSEGECRACSAAILLVTSQGKVWWVNSGCCTHAVIDTRNVAIAIATSPTRPQFLGLGGSGGRSMRCATPSSVATTHAFRKLRRGKQYRQDGTQHENNEEPAPQNQAFPPSVLRLAVCVHHVHHQAMMPGSLQHPLLKMAPDTWKRWFRGAVALVSTAIVRVSLLRFEEDFLSGHVGCNDLLYPHLST
eukprot:5999052-Amphidinium_carterae.1